MDLFLPPVYKVVVETDHPRSLDMKPVIENLTPSIEFPEARLWLEDLEAMYVRLCEK